MVLRPNIHITSLINGKYMALRKLGEGGCGVIYEVASVANPQQRFACKAEVSSADEEATLVMESSILRLLNERKSLHVVNILEMGQVCNYNFIIMTLLGPSMDVLRDKIPFHKFSLFTTIVVGIQAFDSIRELHQLGFIHRDVKPANFAIGALTTPKQRLLHILDFGIARDYLVKSDDGEIRLRKPRKIVPFRGTTRYCSISAQDRSEQGRHDDLWSLFYVLVEMIKGRLPWAGIFDTDVVRLKKNDLKELFDAIPDDVVAFAKHLQFLSYAATPDYPLLRDLLCNVFTRNQMHEDMKLDWEPGGRHERFFKKSSSNLPSVTDKDWGEVSLNELLRVPMCVRNVTKQDIEGFLSPADVDVNTSNDDTLEEKKPILTVPRKKYIYKPRKTSTMSTTQKKRASVQRKEAKWQEKRNTRKLVRKPSRRKEDIIVREQGTTSASNASRSDKRRKVHL